MRRLLLVVVSALGLLGSIGCYEPKICGICDCDIPGHTCCYGPCAFHHIQPAYLMLQPPKAPEPIKELPKEAKPEPPKIEAKPENLPGW